MKQPNFAQAMKQMQKAQAQMAKVTEELADEQVDASAGGGMVKVVMSGDMQVRSVTIDPAAVDPDDATMLEDMVAAAFGEAIRAAQDLANRKMSAVMGGMGLPPGLPGVF
jgi:DNA-binding YbaB/EbfC family protein